MTLNDRVTWRSAAILLAVALLGCATWLLFADGDREDAEGSEHAQSQDGSAAPDRAATAQVETVTGASRGVHSGTLEIRVSKARAPVPGVAVTADRRGARNPNTNQYEWTRHAAGTTDERGVATFTAPPAA